MGNPTTCLVNTLIENCAVQMFCLETIENKIHVNKNKTAI